MMKLAMVMMALILLSCVAKTKTIVVYNPNFQRVEPNVIVEVYPPLEKLDKRNKNKIATLVTDSLGRIYIHAEGLVRLFPTRHMLRFFPNEHYDTSIEGIDTIYCAFYEARRW